VKPSVSPGPLEVWVQFRLKGSDSITHPRPVQIPCGKSAEAIAKWQAQVPRQWIHPGPRREPPSSTSFAPSPDRREPPSESGPPVAVPELVGTDSGVATLRLMTLGLKAEVRRDSSSGSPTGKVVRQSPAPGTSVPKGSKVTLTVR
jgi:hypothetical protein